MSEYPQRVAEPILLAIENITKIVASGMHSYALSPTQVWAWGNNSKGNLGIRFYQEVLHTPQRIGLKVTSIATSTSHTFAWNDSEVYGWGSNLNFELGLKQQRSYPITKLQYFQEALDGGFRVTKLACGQSHSLAIVMMADNKKRLFAWGSSKSHQLTVDSSLIIPYPILCEFDQEIDRIYAKSDYNIITVGSNIYSWGSDTFGRLGMPSTSKIQKTPKKIQLQNVVEVGIGEYHAAACLLNGDVYSWGHGLHGQLGISRLTNQNGPAKIQLNAAIIEVACGEHHTLFLTSTGQVYSCGSNTYGCLGHEQTDEKKRCISPKNIKLKEITSICAGRRHSIALTANKQVYCWGDNSQGQLGIASLNPLTKRESQTSIQLAMSPHKYRQNGIQESLDGVYEDDQKRKVLNWHLKYMQFIARKAKEQKDLMAELEELLRS